MSLSEIFNAFITGVKATGPIEFIAVIAGILSVWFSRKENILVYPIGLINTIFYTYLSIKESLFGEASVNLYYTAMSIYGWYMWSKVDKHQQLTLKITYSSQREWLHQILFFTSFYIVIFTALFLIKKGFAPDVIPWADALASASAFTGMWLMAKKKVESWYWWVITNICSIPLYYVKHYMFTSAYYFILLIMAFWGLAEWRKKAKAQLI